MNKSERCDELVKFLNKYFNETIQTFYDSASISGDYREEIYNRENVRVLYAPYYDYIEIYGLDKEERETLRHLGYNER